LYQLSVSARQADGALASNVVASSDAAATYLAAYHLHDAGVSMASSALSRENIWRQNRHHRHHHGYNRDNIRVVLATKRAARSHKLSRALSILFNTAHNAYIGARLLAAADLKSVSCAN